MWVASYHGVTSEHLQVIVYKSLGTDVFANLALEDW